jgi:ABC-type uncharacterized transport system auxiliary subunit
MLMDPPGTGAGRVLTAALLAGCVCLTGCLSRPPLVKEEFTFSASPAGAAATGRNGAILGIRRLTVAAPFDGQSFVYRTGDFSYEQDPYADFLSAPSQSLEQPLRDSFRNSGAFGAVAEPDSALLPNLLTEINVSQLYGDFRTNAAPAAVLEMRLVFFEASNGVAGKVRFQKTYLECVPLPRRTASALMAGWNEALDKIVANAAADLRGGE